jgi:nucleotidyltransferase substrate binding protein (TIGR01987 family)
MNDYSIKSYDFYYELRILSFVEAIWLYGSRARGNAHEKSDIDLAIICPKATDDDWLQVQRIASEAKMVFAIDLVRFDKLNVSEWLYKNIIENHIVLFERKENNYSWYESFLSLGEALSQLYEMTQESEATNSYVRDATIQRFEFCIELFWKTLKKICIAERLKAATPKEVLQNAFEIGLIEGCDVWFMMIDDRDLVAHIYKFEVAREIYYRIDSYYKHMNIAYMKIQSKYEL